MSFLARKCPWILRLIISQVGWVMMVTGFSMVLYSRLNIFQRRRTRQFVLAMIIFNAVVWHTAMTTITIGKAKERYAGKMSNLPPWEHVDFYFERVQIIMFSTQETIISCLYVNAAYQYIKGRFAKTSKIREFMTQLVIVQIIIIIIDIAMITIDFKGYLQLKLFVHSFVYAAKLELEFVVLNQLVELSQLGVPGMASLSSSSALDPSPKTDLTRPIKAMCHGQVELVVPRTSDDDLDLESQQSRESKLSRCSLQFSTMPEHMVSNSSHAMARV